ncbi:hypothetical protein BDB00DRAFT_423221 [Zychaea mexicana]|uniref:uncharacterized protein n=1 Tax=Zychaea mexicana TaxID=64656 RepID=UPI0022FEBA55|nr:uncharacterized protein BDB00DRAFT_423221 [Zychaea mexicana]KAI9492745.1 hypothetical protein BDB00DRAFT_423221 [Zychaea mexicana]
MNQDVLSKSYTDSLNSYLLSHHDDLSDCEAANSLLSHRRPSHTNASIHSNLSAACSSNILSRHPSTTGYYQSMTNSSSANHNNSNNSPLNMRRGSMSEVLPENAYLSRTNTMTTTTSTQHDDDDENYHDADEPTPLPQLQMFIICTILISEPLTSTILLPFIYFMLKDFHLSDDEKEIGAYAGWISKLCLKSGKGVIVVICDGILDACSLKFLTSLETKPLLLNVPHSLFCVAAPPPTHQRIDLHEIQTHQLRFSF